MLAKRFALPVLLSATLVFGVACTKTLDVADLKLEEDLKAVGEAETGIPVTEVDCPEEIEDPEEGTEFQCDLTLEDGSVITVNLSLEEGEDDKLQATYQGIE